MTVFRLEELDYLKKIHQPWNDMNVHDVNNL